MIISLTGVFMLFLATAVATAVGGHVALCFLSLLRRQFVTLKGRTKFRVVGVLEPGSLLRYNMQAIDQVIDYLDPDRTEKRK